MPFKKRKKKWQSVNSDVQDPCGRPWLLDHSVVYNPQAIICTLSLIVCFLLLLLKTKHNKSFFKNGARWLTVDPNTDLGEMLGFLCLPWVLIPVSFLTCIQISYEVTKVKSKCCRWSMVCFLDLFCLLTASHELWIRCIICVCLFLWRTLIWRRGSGLCWVARSTVRLTLSLFSLPPSGFLNSLNGNSGRLC